MFPLPHPGLPGRSRQSRRDSLPPVLPVPSGHHQQPVSGTEQAQLTRVRISNFSSDYATYLELPTLGTESIFNLGSPETLCELSNPYCAAVHPPCVCSSPRCPVCPSSLRLFLPAWLTTVMAHSWVSVISSGPGVPRAWWGQVGLWELGRGWKSQISVHRPPRRGLILKIPWWLQHSSYDTIL